ncbi:MAG: hypothetical protein IIB59_07500 [Planctomycetes bacterium]|nr:hypothetical protein [Planctomycetota bacterium]
MNVGIDVAGCGFVVFRDGAARPHHGSGSDGTAAEKGADDFEERFWSGTDLTRLYEAVSRDNASNRGMERMFEAGFREFSRMREQARMAPGALVEAAQLGGSCPALSNVDARQVGIVACTARDDCRAGLVDQCMSLLTSSPRSRSGAPNEG